MNETPYIEYLREKVCLPKRAVPVLIELVEEDLSQDDFTAALHDIADNHYYQEPDHSRYDTNRHRFPFPNEDDLESARQWQEENAHLLDR